MGSNKCTAYCTSTKRKSKGQQASRLELQWQSWKSSRLRSRELKLWLPVNNTHPCFCPVLGGPVALLSIITTPLLTAPAWSRLQRFRRRVSFLIAAGFSLWETEGCVRDILTKRSFLSFQEYVFEQNEQMNKQKNHYQRTDRLVNQCRTRQVHQANGFVGWLQTTGFLAKSYRAGCLMLGATSTPFLRKLWTGPQIGNVATEAPSRARPVKNCDCCSHGATSSNRIRDAVPSILLQLQRRVLAALPSSEVRIELSLCCDCSRGKCDGYRWEICFSSAPASVEPPLVSTGSAKFVSDRTAVVTFVQKSQCKEGNVRIFARSHHLSCFGKKARMNFAFNESAWQLQPVVRR